MVAILFHALPESKWVGAIACSGKATCSGALCAARRWLWAESILPQTGDDTAVDRLPTTVRELLLTTPARAAWAPGIGVSRVRRL